MTAATPATPAGEPRPPGGLSAEDHALLSGDVPRDGSADYAPPPPEPIDWEARVKQIAERSRPHRLAQQEARDRRERILRQQRQERARTANRERSAAQVPARYRDAVTDHPAVAEWVHQTLRHGIRSAEGLVLNGPTGCGKTWQAFAAWRTVAQHTGCSAYALSMPSYLDSLRPGRIPLVPLEEAERAELLLLDDLAAERPSEWTVELVYRLIDARWNACLPTIVTVNAPKGELRARLGDRIASRLNGLGRIVSWPTDAPDRRTRAGE